VTREECDGLQRQPKRSCEVLVVEVCFVDRRGKYSCMLCLCHVTRTCAAVLVACCAKHVGMLGAWPAFCASRPANVFASE
jgi:hypothetical protein